MESSQKIDALAVQEVALLLGADLLQPLEEEVKTVEILRLRLIKEMGMVLDRIVMRQVQMEPQEQVHQGQAVPHPQSIISGGIQRGSAKEALAAMSLINSVETAVSVT